MIQSEIVNVFKTHYEMIVEAIDKVLEEVKDILDGTKKREVTNWWLSYIEEQADKVKLFWRLDEFKHFLSFDFHYIYTLFVAFSVFGLQFWCASLQLLRHTSIGSFFGSKKFKYSHPVD